MVALDAKAGKLLVVIVGTIRSKEGRILVESGSSCVYTVVTPSSVPVAEVPRNSMRGSIFTLLDNVVVGCGIAVVCSCVK